MGLQGEDIIPTSWGIYGEAQLIDIAGTGGFLRLTATEWFLK